MAKILVVIKSEPYSDESAYTALKFITTALEDGHELEVFLVQSGVFCAMKDQSPKQMPNHFDMIEKIIEIGGHVVCCGTCIKARGITPDNLHATVEVGTMSIFVEMVANADRVVNF